MSDELQKIIDQQAARIRELEAEVAALKLAARGSPWYCESLFGNECTNREPICYQNEMEDCGSVTCPVCKRTYEIRDHGCDGFELHEC